MAEETFVPEKDLVRNEQGQFETKTGYPVEWVSESNHVFYLQKLKGDLAKYLDSKDLFNHEAILNGVRSELEGSQVGCRLNLIFFKFNYFPYTLALNFTTSSSLN